MVVPALDSVLTTCFLGFRAMLNTIGSLVGAERSGILSCTTYTAGVSGATSGFFWGRYVGLR